MGNKEREKIVCKTFTSLAGKPDEIYSTEWRQKNKYCLHSYINKSKWNFYWITIFFKNYVYVFVLNHCPCYSPVKTLTGESPRTQPRKHRRSHVDEQRIQYCMNVIVACQLKATRTMLKLKNSLNNLLLLLFHSWLNKNISERLWDKLLSTQIRNCYKLWIFAICVRLPFVSLALNILLNKHFLHQNPFYH